MNARAQKDPDWMVDVLAVCAQPPSDTSAGPVLTGPILQDLLANLAPAEKDLVDEWSGALTAGRITPTQFLDLIKTEIWDKRQQQRE